MLNLSFWSVKFIENRTFTFYILFLYTTAILFAHADGLDRCSLDSFHIGRFLSCQHFVVDSKASNVDVPPFPRSIFRFHDSFRGCKPFEAIGGGTSPSSLLGAGTSTGAWLW